jgi:hypothetical protein
MRTCMEEAVLGCLYYSHARLEGAILGCSYLAHAQIHLQH